MARSSVKDRLRVDAHERMIRTIKRCHDRQAPWKPRSLRPSSLGFDNRSCEDSLIRPKEIDRGENYSGCSDDGEGGQAVRYEPMRIVNSPMNPDRPGRPAEAKAENRKMPA